VTNGQEIAEALATALSVIPDVRTYAWMPDSFSPPGIVVGQPSMDWEGDQRTFCNIAWEFPLTVAVLRNTDREAQAALYRVVEAIGDVLSEDHDLGGHVQTSRLLNANPVIISSSGQEFPAYVITVRVIA
jgi:hypothetical protein